MKSLMLSVKVKERFKEKLQFCERLKI